MLDPRTSPWASYGNGASASERLRRMLEEITGLVPSGVLHPPQPVQVYPMSDVEKAFRHMQTGQSKGNSVQVKDRRDQITVTFS